MKREDKLLRLKEIKASIRSGTHEAAWTTLGLIATANDDLLLQTRFAALAKAIPSAVLALKPLRVAILATSTVDQFKDSLRFWLAREGLDAETLVCEFGTIQQTVLNPHSEIYDFKPDVVMLFTNHRDIQAEVPPGSSWEEVRRVVDVAVEESAVLWRFLRDRLNCHIIQNNADLPHSRVFGNFEGTAHWGRLNVLREFNLSVARAAFSGVTILDMEALSAAYGKVRWHDNRYWHHSKHAFALDATGLVAFEAAKVIGAVKGMAKKCLVLDLDNTLWGGVIGDDGIEGIILGPGLGPEGEAYSEFQHYLLALKQRGILLAVCSKNDEEIAREPFLNHPGMALRLDDIAVFVANWDNKADNIRRIAATLNIGLDSIVFIDDNPAERELVRSLIPMVSVPDLPEDPTAYMATVSAGGFFETTAFSKEDQLRSSYYKANASRGQFQAQFGDLSQYLQSLAMKAEISSFDQSRLPRVTQLINKSNQFHLTTTRYNEAELRAMAEDPTMHCLSFNLKDRFGDNGLISAVVLRRRDDESLCIDTWVMSCRVLQRSMEEFICAEMLRVARQGSYRRLLGKYIPTKKNKLVAGLYERLGFSRIGAEDGTTHWRLDLTTPTVEPKTFVLREGVEVTA